MFREIIGETPSDYRVGHGPFGRAQLHPDDGHAAAGRGGGRDAIEQFRRSRHGGGSLA